MSALDEIEEHPKIYKTTWERSTLALERFRRTVASKADCRRERAVLEAHQCPFIPELRLIADTPCSHCEVIDYYQYGSLERAAPVLTEDIVRVSAAEIVLAHES